MNVFEGRQYVPANEVVEEPGFRHPSPEMFAHLKQRLGEDKANELAEGVTERAIAMFDALGDSPIGLETAMWVLMTAAGATADSYFASVADL